MRNELLILQIRREQAKAYGAEWEYHFDASPDEYTRAAQAEGGETELLVEQKFVDANSITLDDACGAVEYPWHGLYEDNFQQLNTELAENLEALKQIATEKDATEFFRAHPSLYEGYFRMPIRVMLQDDGTLFSADGRHRIAVAQAAGNEIPVFVLKDGAVEKLSEDEYAYLTRISPWDFSR